MRSKGMSPILASLGLILVTVIISAFLYMYVTSAYNEQTLKATECPTGTALNFVSNDYPRFSSGRIEATVEVTGNPLTGFMFDLKLVNGTTLSYANTESKTLTAGTIGTLKTDVLPLNVPDIETVTITTACSNVATVERSLR